MQLTSAGYACASPSPRSLAQANGGATVIPSLVAAGTTATEGAPEIVFRCKTRTLWTVFGAINKCRPILRHSSRLARCRAGEQGRVRSQSTAGDRVNLTLFRTDATFAGVKANAVRIIQCSPTTDSTCACGSRSPTSAPTAAAASAVKPHGLQGPQEPSICRTMGLHRLPSLRPPRHRTPPPAPPPRRGPLPQAPRPPALRLPLPPRPALQAVPLEMSSWRLRHSATRFVWHLNNKFSARVQGDAREGARLCGGISPICSAAPRDASSERGIPLATCIARRSPQLLARRRGARRPARRTRRPSRPAQPGWGTFC